MLIQDRQQSEKQVEKREKLPRDPYRMIRNNGTASVTRPKVNMLNQCGLQKENKRKEKKKAKKVSNKDGSRIGRINM